MGHAVLSGASVTLRMLKQQYFPTYLTMFSPVVRSFLHIESLKTELNYLQESMAKQAEGGTLFYCIFDNNSKQLVGGVEIRSGGCSHGQLYGWLHEKFWGQGHYQEALSLITREYFSRSSAEFLDARVDVSNKRSYYALKKFGFADAGSCEGPYGRQYILWLRKNRLWN